MVAQVDEALDQHVRGAVLRPGDRGYDEARAIWNGMVDRRPGAIVQATGAADVIAAVDHAREHGLPLSVRAGGHNVAGRALCDGGITIDLRGLRGVHVDPTSQRAWVDTGATWGDFDHEAQAFGLATTGGMDSRTGVAGLTLGGGLGYLARKHGLAVDNLLGANVVTAAGEFLHVSEDEHPDLFWALRGGGGGFAIATTLEFALHEVGPQIATAQTYYRLEDAPDVLRFYRDLLDDAPDELACYALALHCPPVVPFPEELHGATVVALVATYAGPLDEGREALSPLDDFGDPVVKLLADTPYAAQQSAFDTAAPDGGRFYYKSEYFDALPDDAIDAIVEHLDDPLPGEYTLVGLEPMGGAVNHVAPDATAFPHRSSTVEIGLWGGWADADADDEVTAWVRRFHEAIRPFSNGGTYANYLDRDDQARIRAAFGPNYDRLVEVKQRWDPDDLFGANQFTPTAD